MNLITYIDESQHAGPGHAVVAGFRGTEQQWIACMADWGVALGAQGSLHMNELRWNAKRADKRVRLKLACLGGLPYSHGLQPIYGAVKRSDYADLVEGRTEYEKKICGYVLGLSLICACLTSRLPGHVIIDFVCEQQPEYEQMARGLFKNFSVMVSRDCRNPFFRKIDFVTKDASPRIQLADYLAFAIGKRLDDANSKKDLWCRPIFGGHCLKQIDGRTYDRNKARFIVSSIIDNVTTGRLAGAVQFGSCLRDAGLL